MKSIFFQILFFTSVFTFAQSELKITGTILSQNNSKITQAIDVYLFDGENHLVKSAITQDAKFEFSHLKSGTYHIQVSSDDTAQNEEPFFLEKDKELTIVYQPKSKEIQEVTIAGKRKNFTVENGNITLEVANSQLNKLPTSVDLLAKLPFIRVDANGEGLNFVGKGVPLLYIDNQRVDFTTLSGISVEDIKSVEIIRNPSAKYESEGKAVVKINLKKSRRDGAQLSVSETAMFQKKFSNYLNANFQHKKNKTEWKFNAAYNQINHWESNGFDYKVPSENIESDYIIKSITKRPQTIFGASIYQEINENDYVTFSVNTNLRPDIGDNNTVTNYSENGNFNHTKTLNHQNSNRATINSIFNYNKKLAKIDANIFTGFQYKRESKNVDYDFYNDINNSDYLLNQFRNQHYSGNVYSGRIDGEKKFGEKYILELGGSFTSAETKTDNVTNYTETLPIEYFKYNFKENNIASYLNFGTTLNKWQLKGGLRMEATRTKGFDIVENAIQIERNYADWFPNAEITFEQNNKKTFTLNYRRSISRPNYSSLASGGLYGSPYVEYVGNPDLVPTYSNTISFAMNLNKWSVNASVYSSKNPTGYTLVYDENSHISKFMMVNFDKDLGASIGLDYPFTWKKWTSQNSLSLNYDKTVDSLAIQKKSTPYLYFSTNNTVALWKYLSFLLDGSYITKRIEGLYEGNAMCLVNLGLTSSVSDFDFTFRYNDVFRQMDYVQKMTYQKIESTGTFYGNTPTLSIAVKYNFGKLRKSNYKENTVNENSNRL